MSKQELDSRPRRRQSEKPPEPFPPKEPDREFPNAPEQKFKLPLPIIPEQTIPVKPPTEPKDGPHDSAYVHSALQDRHTLAVLPTLNTDKEGNMRTIIIAALLVMSAFSAWGVAYEAQVLATSHVQGICPPPAVVEKGGCYIVQSSTDANGKTTTSLVPAGTLKP